MYYFICWCIFACLQILLTRKSHHLQMAKANLRIKEINKILSKSSGNDSDSDDDDDDLEDLDGLRTELASLEKSNADNQTKLDNYEKNKKWNVDNMCHVVEERTIVNTNVGESKFSSSGFALPKDGDVAEKKIEELKAAVEKKNETSKPQEVPTQEMAKANVSDKSKPAVTTKKSESTTKPQPQPESKLDTVSPSMLSYHEFTEKYADVVETFMSLSSLDKSKDFLLQNGDVLLQENASNYLLLASLEDEMNGFHEKMKLVARQSQIISNIAELAKSLQRHPGNVIVPFFQRMENKEMYDGFMEGVNGFIKRIEVRAVEKKKEMDAERLKELHEGGGGEDAVDISEIPREERLGPGGLDPLEVFESLPVSMQEAFESREKSKLEEALLSMTQEEAEYHMKRCVDSGLWNA